MQRLSAGLAVAVAVAISLATTPAAASTSPQPRCFGAAARAVAAPCSNPGLTRVVRPTPLDALLQASAFCLPEQKLGVLHVCGFGTHPLQTEWHIALIGDSHAGAWRGALSEVAALTGWRGRSMTYPGCTFSTSDSATRSDRAGCRQFNRNALRWLRQHPEVSTIFVVANATAEARRPPGSSNFEARIRGTLEQWRRVPASVRHIIVLRDTPKRTAFTFTCLQRAIARRRDAGQACAAPRSRVLAFDPQVAAARRWPSSRVQVIDLTSHMCSATRCFPVVGGALVQRDIDHLTDTFSRTLGPFVLQRVRAFQRAWPDTVRRPRCAVLPATVSLRDPRSAHPSATLRAVLPFESANVTIELRMGTRIVLQGKRATVPAGATQVMLSPVQGRRVLPGRYELRLTGTRAGCPIPTTRLRQWRVGAQRRSAP